MSVGNECSLRNANLSMRMLGNNDRSSTPHPSSGEAYVASNLYLQIDGIKGEPQDSTHHGWIEVEAVNWAIPQPKSATASTGGGHTAERCELTEISFTKVADLASPILLQLCAGGKTIPKAKFEFMRADGGDAIKYYEIELENVLIAHVAPSVGAARSCPRARASSFPRSAGSTPSRKSAAGRPGTRPGAGI